MFWNVQKNWIFQSICSETMRNLSTFDSHDSWKYSFKTACSQDSMLSSKSNLCSSFAIAISRYQKPIEKNQKSNKRIWAYFEKNNEFGALILSAFIFWKQSALLHEIFENWFPASISQKLCVVEKVVILEKYKRARLDIMYAENICMWMRQLERSYSNSWWWPEFWIWWRGVGFYWEIFQR